MIEQLFTAKWLEKRPFIAFILGFLYSIIAIISSLIIFPSDLGLASLGFLSLLLLPSLNKLLVLEEKQELSNRKPGLRAIFREHYDIIEVYLFLFLGILIAYMFIFLLMGLNNANLFYSQLGAAGLVGSAINKTILGEVLLNNLKVLLVFFILSLIYGAGSIFFLSWNASAWGVVFAFLIMKNNSLTPFLASLPYLLLEAVGYLVGVIAGGILSKAAIRRHIEPERFWVVVNDSLLMLIIGAILISIGAIIESL